MKARKFAATLISLSMGAVMVHGQEQTPPKDEKAPPPEKEQYVWPIFDIGFGGYDIKGSHNKFKQYAFAPTGIFFRELSAGGTNPAGSMFGFLSLKGMVDQYYVAQGLISLNYGGTVFEGMLTRSNFDEATPLIVADSERKLSEGYLRQQLAQDVNLSFRYKTDQQDRYYEPPKGPLHQKTRLWDLSGDAFVGGGQLGAGLSNQRYLDYTGVYPFNETERWNLHYARQISPSFALDGAYVEARLTQPGLPANNMKSVAINGDWLVSPQTSLLVNYREEWLSLPIVHDAYVKRRMQGSARLVQAWHNWNGQLSYSHKEAERVRADHSFVDVPIWDTVEGKLAGKLTEGLRMTLKGSYEHLRGLPIVFTDDARGLFWNNRTNLQLKLDHSGEKCTAYAAVTLNDRQNTQRSFELTGVNYLFGASYTVNPVLEFFGEYSLDENRTSGAPADVPRLGMFFPSGRVFTIGANWSLKPSIWVSGSYTDFATDNDNPLFLQDGNVNGRFFTLSVKHRTAKGNEYGIVYAPWHYGDLVTPQMGFNASSFMVTANVKF